jgi:hypothetical protein
VFLIDADGDMVVSGEGCWSCVEKCGEMTPSREFPGWRLLPLNYIQ